MKTDVIVVGGGIVGTAVAYHLVRGGARTLLIDRHDAGRATAAGAGILAPEMSDNPSDSWFELAVAAGAYYPALTAELAAAGATETGYSRCGMLLVAADDDELAPFTAARERILARQRRRGAPPAAELGDASLAEAQALFPPLAPVRRALYFSAAARLDGRLFTSGMRQVAEREGLQHHDGGVIDIQLADGGVTAVTADGQQWPAQALVIAGGAWSPALAEKLGVALPVTPQRGQLVHLRLPGVAAQAWPMVGGFRDHYLVPWTDGRLVAGATRERSAGFAPWPTAAGLAEVLAEALRLAPGLALAELLEVRVGLRPLAADGLPILGALPGQPRLYVATGHGPTGLQLGPYCGRLLAEELLGERPSAELAPFRPERFAGG